MEQNASTQCPRSNAIWGAFLLILGIGWGLSAAGVIAFDFWRFVGPVALVAVGVMMLWPTLSRGA